MKSPAGYLFVTFAGLFMLLACNNNTGNESAAAKAKSVLPGQWKISTISTDPADAAAPSHPGDDSIVITFKEDGSGSSTSPGGNSSFKWMVGEKDNWLRITDNATGQVNALALTKMSSSSFTVKDTSAHPVQWETFQRQK